MSNSTTEPKFGESEKAALVAELQRLYARLSLGATGGMMNAVTSIAVGAGVIAATQVPESFVAVPLFWTAWLLHAQILDLEALKDGEHARWLEALARNAFGVEIFVSESRLTRRAARGRPLVFYASFLYTALLNAGSWIAAVVILVHQGRTLSAVVVALVGVLLNSVVAWTSVRRSHYANDYAGRLRDE